MGLFDTVLSADQSLIRNEAALDYEFLPKLLPFRESEQKYMANCMKPLFTHRSGRNLLIYGPPGIGKSAAVRHVLKDLEEETDEVQTVYINCWKYNTSYKILVELCELLGYRFTQNKKTTELFKIAIQLLNKKPAVLVFDEIDKAEDFDFLYSFIEDVFHKSIFLLTNYKSWLLELDERIRSRLVAELQEFKEYSESETRCILKERLEYAFVPNVWDVESFELVVSKTAKIKDIRSGLFLLKESALLAEEKSSKKITIDHAKRAIEKLDEFSIKNSEELDEESKFIHNVVKQFSGKKIGDLFEEYQKVGGKSSYKTFQRRLNKLQEGRFVKLTKQTGAGGNTTIVERKLTDF
jgi:archaeal cell division control protein 6